MTAVEGVAIHDLEDKEEEAPQAQPNGSNGSSSSSGGGGGGGINGDGANANAEEPQGPASWSPAEVASWYEKTAEQAYVTLRHVTV